MIIISILSLLLSNAVNVRRDISILYNRIAILLTDCILNGISSLTIVTRGIGLHGGGGILLSTNIKINTNTVNLLVQGKLGHNSNNGLIISGFSNSFKVKKKGSIIRCFATNVAVKDNLKLDPFFVTGFAEGESCFHVSIVKNNKLKPGFQVKLSFTITLHIKYSAVLALIKKVLIVGKFYNTSATTVILGVYSIEDLEVIISQLKKFLLITGK
jgi:LAGLIDADG endonuclease